MHPSKNACQPTASSVTPRNCQLSESVNGPTSRSPKLTGSVSSRPRTVSTMPGLRRKKSDP